MYWCCFLRSFQHFDESTYFNNGQKGLKEEFRQHFRNVTRIMDCVGCDKCKLWGKLQVSGGDTVSLQHEISVQASCR